MNQLARELFRDSRHASPVRIYKDTDAARHILRDVDFVFIHQILTYSRTQYTGLTQKHCYTHVRELLARQTERARREFRIGLAKQWLH